MQKRLKLVRAALMALLLFGALVPAHAYYDPSSQRWLNRDPIEEAGGINLYSYVGNSPITQIDPEGLTIGSQAGLFWDWLIGGGKRERSYTDGSTEVEEMKNSPGGNKLREEFYSGGCQGVARGQFGTYEALWKTVLYPFTADWRSTAFQVGGYYGATVRQNGDGTVTFTIPNDAGLHSASWFHVLPNMPDQLNLPLVGPVTSPMRTIKQKFTWTEPIDRSKCPCPSLASSFQRNLTP